MNEIVKYDNYMNSLNFKRFTAIDLNFLMVLCNKMRDKDLTEITITFDDLKKKTGYTQTSINKFIDDLDRMNKKLMGITCKLKTDSKIIMFVLFPTFEIDIKKQVLIVSVNPKFKFILNELIKNFTRFELDEFVRLDSKYSKNLYRLLKQYRCTGHYEVTVEKFRQVMDIPDSYTNRDIMSKVIHSSLKELEPYFEGLHCKCNYEHKRGKPVKGYLFTFKPEKARNREKHIQESGALGKSKAENLYTSFHQREYDYEELERELLRQRIAEINHIESE